MTNSVYVLECEVDYEGSWIIDVFESEEDANIERDINKEKDGSSDLSYNVIKWDVVGKDEKLIDLAKQYSSKARYPKEFVNALSYSVAIEYEKDRRIRRADGYIDPRGIFNG